MMCDKTKLLGYEPERTQFAAYREAGSAVAASLLGVKFAEVRIGPKAPPLGRVQVERPDEGPPPWEHEDRDAMEKRIQSWSVWSG